MSGNEDDTGAEQLPAKGVVLMRATAHPSMVCDHPQAQLRGTIHLIKEDFFAIEASSLLLEGQVL